MQKQELSALRFLVPALGVLLVGGCAAAPEEEPTDAAVDIGYPLAKEDPTAVLDLNPQDYPEIVVPPRSDRVRSKRPFTGMVHYDLATGATTHRRVVDGKVIEEALPPRSALGIAQQLPHLPEQSLEEVPIDPKAAATAGAPVGDPEEETPAVESESSGSEQVFVAPTSGLMEAVDRERERAAAKQAESLAEPGKSTQAIFAPRIDSTTTIARTAVKIFSVFPKGWSGCSGTMIGRRTVLTAGHCLKHAPAGGKILSGRVVPGLDGTYMPFGDARIASVDIDDNWENSADNDDDWGLIYLDRDIGDITGTFGLTTPLDRDLNGAQMSAYGYPDINGALTLNAASGNVTCTDEWSVFHNSELMAGFSGSGVTFAGGRHVFGVHRGADTNLWCSPHRRDAATRINPPRLAYIEANLDESTPVVRSLQGWSFIGGSSSTQVTGVSWGTGRNDYFMRALSDFGVYHKWQVDGSFAPAGLAWEAQGGKIIGKVGVTSRGSGLLDLFARSYANPGQACTRWFTGNAWGPSTGWQCFSDFVITGSPTALSSHSSRLHVFARKTNGRVFVKDWTQAGGWTAPLDLGGNTKEDIAAVSRGSNIWDIFIRDSGTRQLCTKSWVNGTLAPPGTAWTCFPGTDLASAPVAVASSIDALDVFYTTVGSILDHSVSQMTWRSNTQWQGPHFLGGSSSNSIAAVSRPGSNRAELFVVGSDGVVYTKSYVSGAWNPSKTGWTSLGGDMLDITALSSGPSRVDLVGRARSLGVFTRSSSTFGTW
jgi:V8-like Glu-specific endopeptidase